MSYITIVSPSSSFCGKSFGVNEVGEIVKHRATAPAKCHAKTVSCESLNDLASHIRGLDKGMAIILGYVPETIGENFFHLWSEKALTEEFPGYEKGQVIRGEDNELYLSRLKQSFKPSPFICLDRDIDADAPEHMLKVQRQNSRQFISTLCTMSEEVNQAFHGADYLAIPSSSSQVYKIDGTPYSTEISEHIFFEVEDAEDIERFAVALSAQAIVNGLSYIKTIENKNGGKASRNQIVFDASVFTRGRLFFESAPRIMHPELMLKPAQIHASSWMGKKVNTYAVQNPNFSCQRQLTNDYKMEFKTSGLGPHFEREALDENLVIETEIGEMTVREYQNSKHLKLRCQTPFRDSTSWAAYLNKHDTSGNAYLWDEGTRTKYTLFRRAEGLEELVASAQAAIDRKDISNIVSILNHEFLVEVEQDEFVDAAELVDSHDHPDHDELVDNMPDEDVQLADIPAPANPTLIPMMSFTELLTTDWRSREEMSLWGNGVISVGSLNVIGGAPKIGKSTFVAGFLMHAACGKTYLDFEFQRPLKIQWFQAELRSEYLFDRSIAALGHFSDEEVKLICKNLHVSGPCDLALDKSHNIHYRNTMEGFKPDMVCIDPLRNLAEVSNENDMSEMKSSLQKLKSTAIEINPDVAVIVVHHTKKYSKPKKGEEVDPFDLFAGSGALRGYYDAGMMLLPDPQCNDTRKLHIESRNAASMPSTTLRRDGGLFVADLAEFAASVDQLRENTKRSVFVDILFDYLRDNEAFSEESAIEWGLARDTTNSRMKDEGFETVAKSTASDWAKDMNNVAMTKANGKLRLHIAM